MCAIKIFIKSPLFQAVGTYGALTAFRQLLPLLLLPIMTHYLAPADYGTLAMFNVLISLMYILIGLNFDTAIAREYFERDKIDFPNYIANCLGCACVCALLFLPIIIFVGPSLENITGVPYPLLFPVLIIALCRFISQIIMIIWQSAMRALPYSIMQALQILVEAGLTILFIAFFKMGLQGRVDAVLITSIIFAFIGFVYLLRGGWFKWGLSREHIKAALLFGLPLMPHTVGAIVISMTDRALLMNMVGAEDTGLYFIGFQIGNALNMVVWAFNQAWNPWLFKELKKDDPFVNNKIIKSTYLYVAAILALAALVTCIAPIFFKYFLNIRYAGGIPVVGWIAFGSAFLGMYYVVSGYIIYQRKTHILSWITVFVGIVNVLITYVLIKKFGYIGAAQGSMIAHIMTFFMAWILAIKIHPMPWLPSFGKAAVK